VKIGGLVYYKKKGSWKEKDCVRTDATRLPTGGWSYATPTGAVSGGAAWGKKAEGGII